MRLCGDFDNSCVFRRGYAPITLGHFVPKSTIGGASPDGYSFSEGNSIKVLSTDELSQVYTFLTACTIYPKGRKSARKLSISTLVVEWKKHNGKKWICRSGVLSIQERPKDLSWPALKSM